MCPEEPEQLPIVPRFSSFREAFEKITGKELTHKLIEEMTKANDWMKNLSSGCPNPNEEKQG